MGNSRFEKFVVAFIKVAFILMCFFLGRTLNRMFVDDSQKQCECEAKGHDN